MTYDWIAALVFIGSVTVMTVVGRYLAFEVPGQLIERPVNIGDEVEVGQVLARLDPRDYENELRAASTRFRRQRPTVAVR